MLLLALLACAPAHLRIPGPLDGLGEVPLPLPPPPVAAATAPGPAEPPRTRADDPVAERVVATAEGLVGASRIVVNGDTFRWDCSGFVSAALAGAGGDWGGGADDLFAVARDARVLHRKRRPSPGDVAFFDNTYDADGDGRTNDVLTHVALVEAVAEDGTITLIHLGSKGIVRIHMNLVHPEDRDGPEGQRWNDNLRFKSSKDSPRTRYLASELWVGFGSFWRLLDERATAQADEG